MKRRALAAAALALAITACGGADKTDNRPRAPKTLAAGELGHLPPAQTSRPGPPLVLPRPALTVPGRYPIDALVAFRVPVRNDGNRVLRITKIDPG
jgi:hypothetical protein